MKFNSRNSKYNAPEVDVLQVGSSSFRGLKSRRIISERYCEDFLKKLGICGTCGPIGF